VSPEEDALRIVIEALRRLDVPHMVTGSVASSYYGRPRTTHDADVVIDPTATQLDDLVVLLTDAGFYADRDAARRALAHRRQFNVIAMQSGAKIDVIIKKNRAFSDVEFARREARDLTMAPGVSLVSAEDAVLSKLEWARAGGDSERQIADAAAIVALTPSLDRAYIDQWAGVLGVTDLWLRLRS
jgi:hypothetical protein